MIQFTLKCPDGHRFDSWFQSAEAFDKLAAGGMVACAVCGSQGVEKAVMAPRVVRSGAEERVPERPLSQPRSPAEQAISELRRRIEQQTEDVGRDFAREARAMHEGDAPHRAIRGEAATEEAKSLIEDGVPIVPLPFLNQKRSN